MPNRRAFAYFAYREHDFYGGTLAPTDQWWHRHLRHRTRATAIFGEVGFDVTENFTITAGGRWFEYDRTFNLHQESPAGFSGFSLTDATRRRTTAGRWPSST